MTTCYLTIDDSPSPHTSEMIDFLMSRNIPALLFIRGDMVDSHGDDSIIKAVQNGFVIGNHSYSHKPFGELSYDEAIADIEKCEEIIDSIYKKAATKCHGKYFRFPYLDRGNGDRIERHFETTANIDINQNTQVQKIQGYLLKNGYTQPFQQCTHPIYKNKSIAGAADCLMTYTSYDWMLTDRHRGKWDFKTLDDLKARIDTSDMKPHQGNILIFHDQGETLDTFKSLIDHMVNTGYEFLSYDN